MAAHVIVLAVSLILSLGAAGNAHPPEPVLETLSVRSLSATSVVIQWDDIGAPLYAMQGRINGNTVIDEQVSTYGKITPVVPDTDYVFTVSPLRHEANAVTTMFKTPKAPQFDLYKADVYNTYLAFVPNPDVGLYEQKRTGVKTIGADELFANISNGHRYFIHMGVAWRKTSEQKILGNCVLVMRVPNGDAFAWEERSFVLEGRRERCFLGCELNDYLRWYRWHAIGMTPGMYAFEYYVDGMFVGKAEMKIT